MEGGDSARGRSLAGCLVVRAQAVSPSAVIQDGNNSYTAQSRECRSCKSAVGGSGGRSCFCGSWVMRMVGDGVRVRTLRQDAGLPRFMCSSSTDNPNEGAGAAKHALGRILLDRLRAYRTDGPGATLHTLLRATCMPD